VDRLVQAPIYNHNSDKQAVQKSSPAKNAAAAKLSSTKQVAEVEQHK